jgi:hypothetical protein
VLTAPARSAVMAPSGPDHGRRVARAVLWLSWPVGLVLALGHLLGGLLSDPIYAVVDVAYVTCVVVSFRRAQVVPDRTGTVLLGVGVAVFALASLTGVPTAQRPTAMLFNAAALLAVAILLMGGAAALAHRTGGLPATLGLVAIGIGSAGYLLNLLARWAVVLSGAGPQQAAVEERAWVASSYLNGLGGPGDFMTVLLVWLDLVQLAYLVLVYAGFAVISMSLGRIGAISRRASRALAATGSAAALLATGAAVTADALPGPAGAVAASVAFVLTIPFMSTLVPALLGTALLTRRQ